MRVRSIKLMLGWRIPVKRY